jgi:hypothetical protein
MENKKKQFLNLFFGKSVAKCRKTEHDAKRSNNDKKGQAR